jgi:transmembrane sensor
VSLTRGEAHFTVAKNRERPFIVSAAGVDVRVVGTVFNVRLRSEAVDVLVTEGKVRVGSTADISERAAVLPSATLHSELGAGQKLSIGRPSQAAPLPTSPVELSAAEIKQTLAWQTRRLDFDSAPLSDIVAEINRYNWHQLVIADPRLNAQRFGGSFPAGDHETFVRMLEANFGVVAERAEGETRLRSKAP